MKLLQIAFIATLGVTCCAVFATSETLHGACASAQVTPPAPTKI